MRTLIFCRLPPSEQYSLLWLRSRTSCSNARDVYVLLATTAWATTTIAVRKYLRYLDAGVVTLYRYVVASAVFVVYLSIQSSLVLSNILLSIGGRKNYYGSTSQFFVELDNLKKFEPVHPGHVQIEKNHAWPCLYAWLRTDPSCDNPPVFTGDFPLWP